MAHVRYLMLALTALVGCASYDPAPQELGDLMPFFWENWEGGAEDLMANAVVNLGNATTEVTLGHPLKSILSPMATSRIDSLHLSDRDAGHTAGLLTVTSFKCTLTQLEKILASKDQMAIYPDGGYITYNRVYTTSDTDYFARKNNFLKWNVDLTATHVYDMSESLVGGLRYVADRGGGKSPFGPAIIQRTYMPSPAVFGDPDHQWLQDYQIEVYFEREANRIVHAYATWREVHLPLNFDSGKDFYNSQSLSNMVDWDQATEDACAAGKP